jgi:geranylgeranyl pyrophosphate synthase
MLTSEDKKILVNMLGNKKVSHLKVSKLINKLGGIAETEDLADKYIKKCKASALKIDKHIQQEMLKLLDSSINRSK